MNEYSKDYREARREKLRLAEQLRRDTPENREKARKKTREWYKLNKDKAKDTRFKKKYNISLEDWDHMFEVQGGRCAICKTHQADLEKSLCVDHDHDTGEVRGLLCHTCNRALGLLKDRKDILLAAVEYLDEAA